MSSQEHDGPDTSSQLAEIARLERELAAIKKLADERWQAIERLAPAAKRLRLERDQLKSECEQLREELARMRVNAGRKQAPSE